MNKLKKYLYTFSVFLSFFAFVSLFFIGFIEAHKDLNNTVANATKEEVDLSTGDVLTKVFELNSLNKHKEAIDLLVAAIKNQPQDSLLKTLLSTTFSLFLEAEIKTGENLINENENNTKAYIKVAEAFELLDNKAQALEILIRATNKNPKDTTLWMNIAKLELKSNRPHEALDVFKEVLRIDNKNSDAYNNIAFILLKNSKSSEKDIKMALEYAQKANSIKSNKPEYIDTMAEAYYRNGDYNKAQELKAQLKKLGINKL